MSEPAGGKMEVGDYFHVEAAARRGLFNWREKPHNAKWWKRIDGTPIPNDLIVCIAEEVTRQVALVREEATLAEHRSHVEYENELYATLVDPVAEGSIKEAEMRKQLLESARWYRQHVHDLETQLNTLHGPAASPDALRVALERIRDDQKLTRFDMVVVAKRVLASSSGAQITVSQGAPAKASPPSWEKPEWTYASGAVVQVTEPWLYAIEGRSEDGRWSWHDGEQCVFADQESAQDEVDSLNDDVPDWQGSPYRVVPLYRAAPPLSKSVEKGREK